MASLESRLQKLSRIFSRCSECGSGEAALPSDRSPLGYKEDVVVEWDDGWREDENGELVPADEEDVVPEFCELCGEALTIIVTWGDIDELEAEARADGKYPRA